jgi:hypothetical protein
VARSAWHWLRFFSWQAQTSEEELFEENRALSVDAWIDFLFDTVN